MTGVAEAAGRRPAWARVLGARATPAAQVAALIVAGFALRLLFAATLGLGIDESYMVASGRAFHLGYFDHPPASWWLSAGAAHLFGTETDVVVRLPFIALFALTTWLIYRLGARLHSERAGLWAAVALNLSPVFGVTTGSWVLPDGPLICALAGAALCLAHALDAPRASWRWWLGAGLCSGLALFSKYSAVLVIGGAFLYLLTQPAHRRWLARPQPYVAGAIATLIFAPVIAWNARHGFDSFAFQGGRAIAGGHWHPLMPFVVLAGSALFVLPWIWLPMMAEFVRGLRRGPRDAALWLQCCLGAPAILAFPLIAAWTDQRVLFHWAAPGYLMLFPALGAWIDRRLRAGSPLVRRTLIGTAALVLSVVAVIATEVRWDWLPIRWEALGQKRDPAIQGMDWVSLRTQLERRGLLDRPDLLVAGIGWHDCGKIDYALGGRPKLICLTSDPREYGLNTDLASLAGRDMLIIAPGNPPERVAAAQAGAFESVEILPKLTIDHAGHPVLPAALVLGRGFRSQAVSRR